MSEEVAEKKTLRLGQTVVSRRCPMTAKGSDLLRAVREKMVEEFEAKTGTPVEIPFPVVIHQMLVEYCEWKGIEPHVRTDERSSS